MISLLKTYLRKYRGLILLVVLLSVVTGLISLFAPYIMGKSIDAAVAGLGENKAYLVKCLVILGAFYALSALLSWLIPIISARIASETVEELRKVIFGRITKLPLRFFDTHPHGDIMTRLINDCECISEGLSQGLVQFVSCFVTAIGTVIAMLIISPLIALIVVVLTPLSVFVGKGIVVRSKKLYELQQKKTGELNGLAEEYISGGSTVRAYNMEDCAEDQFGTINEELRKTGLKAHFFSAMVNPSTRLVNNLAYICVGITGAIFAVSGFTGGGKVITIGVIATLLSYATQFAKPINEIAGVINQLQNAVASSARISEILSEEPESDKEAKMPALEKTGGIEFGKMSFYYSPDRPLMKDVSISVTPGSVVGIVGKTGCGKTTLVNLLMRFYDPVSGKISINGEDTSEYSRSSVRENFSMVLQDTWLFEGTVRENIAYAKPGASDEEIVAAAKSAHAHNFIKRLPKGYDTVITGENSLSAGQKQLITIARAMLKDGKILILDEATSSVDIVTEKYVSESFSYMMKGKTTFLIAHRLSTVRNADIILVMDKGNIVEAGTHEELCSSKGVYYNLLNA